MIPKNKPVKQEPDVNERAVVGLSIVDLGLTTDPTTQTEDKPAEVQPPTTVITQIVGNTTVTQLTQTGDKPADVQPPAEIIAQAVANATGTQQRGEDLSAWLKEAAWPQPKWLIENLSATKTGKKFDDYVKSSLRWRYLSLENEFRTALNNFYGTKYVDRVIARRIISFLESTRPALERENCDVLAVTNMLNMVEQYMVYLYPPHVAEAQASALSKELTEKRHTLAGIFTTEMLADSKANIDKLRAALDRVKDSLNQGNQRQQVDDRLQIERLDMLVQWGKWIVVVMIFVVPLLFKNATGTNGVPKLNAVTQPTNTVLDSLTGNTKATTEVIIKLDSLNQPVAGIFNDTVLVEIIPQKLQSWFIMLVIALIGAVGAFLSGLMKMRDETITMSEFSRSIVQFKLRPIVGGIVAIIITTLLSWNLISGLQVTSAGMYILAAFLCGFSERYFLDLLDIKGKETVAAAAKEGKVETFTSVAVSAAAEVPKKQD
jgi:hypothetical protein